MSVQNILLGNGSERDFDRLNLDSTSEAVLATANVRSISSTLFGGRFGPHSLRGKSLQ